LIANPSCLRFSSPIFSVTLPHPCCLQLRTVWTGSSLKRFPYAPRTIQRRLRGLRWVFRAPKRDAVAGYHRLNNLPTAYLNFSAGQQRRGDLLCNTPNSLFFSFLRPLSFSFRIRFFFFSEIVFSAQRSCVWNSRPPNVPFLAPADIRRGSRGVDVFSLLFTDSLLRL